MSPNSTICVKCRAIRPPWRSLADMTEWLRSCELIYCCSWARVFLISLLPHVEMLDILRLRSYNWEHCHRRLELWVPEAGSCLNADVMALMLCVMRWTIWVNFFHCFFFLPVFSTPTSWLRSSDVPLVLDIGITEVHSLESSTFNDINAYDWPDSLILLSVFDNWQFSDGF